MAPRHTASVESTGLDAPAPSPPDLVRYTPPPWRRWAGLSILVAALAVLIVISLGVGARSIPPSVVAEAIFSPDSAIDDHSVVRTLRLPRTALGVLVGMALGLAGALMQGLTRNPLADPGILGTNAGAALAVVGAIHWLDVGGLSQYVWFGFVGAAAASVLVYFLGSLGRSGPTPVKLTLAGAAVSILLGSITSAILLIDRSALNQVRFWAAGSIAGRSMDMVADVAPFLIVGAVVALAAGPTLNALSLGDDLARSIGIRLGTARLTSAAAVVLLCGAATAVAGPIAFVGFTAPHVARVITGPDYRWILPFSGILAAVILTGSDIAARIVAPPTEVPVGVVTALVGGPLFVLVARRRRLAEI